MPPPAPRARKAEPTTTVGSTNGAVTRALARERPGNEKRETAQVMGAAATRVRATERTDCHTENHSALLIPESASTSPKAPNAPSSPRERPRMRARG